MPPPRFVAVGADELLEGLTPPQAASVTHRGGPLLIVAGAGSGKTRVLTRRIAHLIATGDAAPWQILAITFTNKAADEMRSRVADLVGPRAERMWVSTFHSACVRILRAHGDRLGYKGSFTIYDDADSRRLVEIIARELDIDTKKLSPRSMLGQISQAKSQPAGPGRVPGRRHLDLRPPHRRRLRPLPAAHAGGQRHGLRRPAAQRRPALRRAPRRARALPQPLHPRADRRVPGHQRRAERAGRPAGRRPPQHRGGGRQRPVGLPVPGRRHLATSSTSRRPSPTPPPSPSTRTSARPRPSSTPPTPSSPTTSSRKPKALWTDQGAGDQIVRYRAEDEHDEAEWVAHEIVRLRSDKGLRVGRRRHLLPDQRPEPGPRGGHGPRRGPLQGGGRHQVLRPQGGQGRPRLPAGAGQPRRRGQLAAHRQRAQARRGRHLGGQAVRLRRPAGDLLRRRGGRGRRGRHRRQGGQGAGGPGRPAGRAAAQMAVPDLVDDDGDALAPGLPTELVPMAGAADGRGGRSAGAAATRRRRLRTARPRRAGHRRRRAHRLPERAAVRGDHRGPRPGGERGRAGRAWPTSTAPWPSSSRPPRWWPTPTSSTATAPRCR